MRIWEAEIAGEPASKSNGRRIVRWRGRLALLKSKKALTYSEAFRKQAKPLKHLLEGDLKATITVYYQSRRPDLDESLILDLLQGVAYKNDRQVKEKVVGWALDRVRPRATIRIETIPAKAPR